MKYDLEKFVRAWQTSNNSAEAAAKMGMSVNTANVYASRLRKRGVSLKQYPRGQHSTADYEALAKLARELAQE